MHPIDYTAAVGGIGSKIEGGVAPRQPLNEKSFVRTLWRLIGWLFFILLAIAVIPFAIFARTMLRIYRFYPARNRSATIESSTGRKKTNAATHPGQFEGRLTQR
jgi:hypothetical protein